MAIDPTLLANWSFGEEEQSFTRRDTILYALGVGLGVPATDLNQLKFLYERDLLALPTMAVVLGYRGFWMQDPATGINWQKVLHVGQSVRLFKPLPVEGLIRSRQRVASLIDRGTDRGALLVVERDIFAEGQSEPVASVEQTNILREDGGCGGSFGSIRSADKVPDRAPDRHLDVATFEQSALLYRLCGDYNPLHADPAVAAAAGFPRPILHGLCTFGVIGRAVLEACLSWDPARLLALRGRFSSPVFPGDTIRTQMWFDGDRTVHLQARALERDVVVFDAGVAELS